MSSYPYSLSTMIESSTYSRWPFNGRLETAPRSVNEAGIYSITALANILSLGEVATAVWTRAGRLIPMTIEAGGEPSIEMYRQLTGQFVRGRVEILHCAEGYQLTGTTPTAVQYCPSQGIKEVNNSVLRPVLTHVVQGR